MAKGPTITTLSIPDIQRALNALADMAGSGGGPVPVGNPLSMTFYDGVGALSAGDPKLLIRPVGNYGRPEIWDYRTIPGPSNTWAVFRQGAWEIDGDPFSAKASGFVTYGSNSQNNGPNSLNGGMGFYTSHSWGALQIINGVLNSGTYYQCGYEDGSDDAPGFYPFKNINYPTNPLDPGFALCDNTGAIVFYVKRSTGQVFLKERVNSMQGVVPLGPGGTAVVPNTLITANTRIMVCYQDGGPPPVGFVYPSARTLGLDFTISSTNPADANKVVAWQLWEPAP